MDQETAELIAGQFGGLRVMVIEQLEVLKAMLNVLATGQLPTEGIPTGTDAIDGDIQFKIRDLFEFGKGMVDSIGNKIDTEKLGLHIIDGNNLLKELNLNLKNPTAGLSLESPEIVEAVKQTAEVNKANATIWARMEEYQRRTAEGVEQTARNNTDISVMAGYLKSINTKIAAGSPITLADQLKAAGF